MILSERARRALSRVGFTVTRPGEALGVCKAPYLVVFDGGTTPLNRAGALSTVGVAAYVPLGRQGELEPMLLHVRAALENEGLTASGVAQPEAVDEAFRAHTQTMEFSVLCAAR